MILGNTLLWLSFIFSLLAICTSIVESKRYASCFFSFLQFSFVSIALLELINAYVTTDYSLATVLENSNELLPIMYKISAVWAGHEGSMLLLLWCLSFASLLQVKYLNFKEVTAVQHFVLMSFVVLVIFTSNPFSLSDEIFPKGRGLNPLLQDFGLIIHPPILYFGYGCSAIPFSVSLGALLRKDVTLLKKAYIWIFLSWAFLSLGIGLGSWWSYRELGWGGFWFWDPVENVALIGWLSLTISLHVNKIKISNRYKSWRAMSNIVSFLFILVGLLLVRSGVLTSVHSFAFDLARGQSFLILVSVFLVLSSIVYFKYQFDHKVQIKSDYIVVFFLVLLLLATLLVLLGVLYPIFYSYIYSQEIVVDQKFYSKSLFFIFLPVAYIGAWQGVKKIRDFFVLIALSYGIAGIIFYLEPIDSIAIIIFLQGSILLLLSTIISFARLLSIKKVSMFLGHLGFALLLCAASLYYSYKYEESFFMKKNDKIEKNGYSYLLHDIIYENEKNFLSRKVVISVSKNSKELGVVYPETRFYPVEQLFTSESSRINTYFGDLYFTIGEIENHRVLVSIKYEPFIYLIWISVICMFSSVWFYVFSRWSRYDPKQN